MSKTIIERMCSIAEKMRPEGEKGGMPIINMKNATADIRSLAKTLGRARGANYLRTTHSPPRSGPFLWMIPSFFRVSI